jgi:hypothetical protein
MPVRAEFLEIVRDAAEPTGNFEESAGSVPSHVRFPIPAISSAKQNHFSSSKLIRTVKQSQFWSDSQRLAQDKAAVSAATR